MAVGAVKKSRKKPAPRLVTVNVLLPDAAARAIMAATKASTPSEAAERTVLLVREVKLPPKKKLKRAAKL